MKRDLKTKLMVLAIWGESSKDSRHTGSGFGAFRICQSELAEIRACYMCGSVSVCCFSCCFFCIHHFEIGAKPIKRVLLSMRI